MSSPPVPCHVFTPEWVADLKRRYGRSPAHARPTLYDFWTSDEDRPKREVIERWVDLLAPTARARVVPKLRKPEQFGEVYNELAVGDSLRRMGHVPEYEREMDGLTPDWFLPPRGNDPAFVLEVVSSNAPEERDRHDDGWDILRRRLEGLAGDAELYVQPPFYDGSDKPVSPPDGARQKEIAQAVRRWLDSGPPPGWGLQFDGVVIRFVGRNPSGGGVACGLSCLPFWVDGDPLHESIKDKARSYRDICKAARLPYVVCVIPDFRSGRGLEHVQEAVLGELRCRMGQSPDGQPRQEYYRNSDGLFSKYPTLSAVTLGVLRGHEVTHVVLHNPAAAYPLGKDAFPAAESVAEDF